MRQPPEKSRQGAGLLFGVEAEPGQDRRGARRGAVRLDIGEARMNFADAVGIWAVSASASRRGSFRIGGEHGLQQALGPVRRFLGQHADAGIGRQADVAAVGLKRAGDQFQQGGFAGPVAADEAGMVAGGQRHADIVEKRPAGDPIG